MSLFSMLIDEIFCPGVMEIGEGVGVVLDVFKIFGSVIFLPRLILPVKTAIKTTTTTRPKMKEIALLKPSICLVLYHYRIYIATPLSGVDILMKK